MSINKAQIVAEFGNVYRDGGQGMKDLQTVLFQKTEFDALFPTLPTNDTVVYKATASITRMLQAFQKQFTPVGDTLFELEKIPLHHVKVDVAETPDDLMPSWLGFLVDGSLKRSDWPFVKWWIEKLIIPKIQEDIEVNEAFKGVRGTVVPGTPSAAGASMDGIRKTIRDGYTAGKTKVITMGAVPTDPVEFVNYVEDFVAQIPELFRNNLSTLNMNKTLRDRFKTGSRIKYNVNYAQIGELLTVIDTDIKLVGSTAQAGSSMIWTTLKGNSARPVKFGQNQGKFDIQLFERVVKLLSDWYVGYGFWYLPFVYHNDQDLV